MRISESEFTKMRSWERCHAATVLDERAREIEAEIKHAFVELGLLCCEMDERELFKEMLDKSGKPRFQFFDHWLRHAMPTQRSTAYAAKSAMETLRGIVPASELQQMPRINIESLGRCSRTVAQDKTLWPKAKELTQNEFVRAVMDRYPGQHLEERDRYRFAPTVSQRQIIDAALSAVRILMDDEKMSREDCLEALARAFLEDHEDELNLIVAAISELLPLRRTE